MSKRTQLYEEFHKDTSSQKFIIKNNNFTYRIIIKFIKKYISKGQTVLDIGCGAGTVSFYISKMGAKVTGIDISEKAVSACNSTAKVLRLKNTKFEAISFPEKFLTSKFEVIICLEVLEHLRNDKLALQHIYSMLKSGGTLILSTPSKHAPLYRLGLLKGFDTRVGHLRRYELDDLLNDFSSVGFEIIETAKTEGILRNFLFTSPIAGKGVKFIKFFLSDIVSFIDELLVIVFGESDLFIIARKPL